MDQTTERLATARREVAEAMIAQAQRELNRDRNVMLGCFVVALVEQSAAAAKSMQQQAQRLQQLVSFFRLGSQARYDGVATSSVSYASSSAAEHQDSMARAA